MQEYNIIKARIQAFSNELTSTLKKSDNIIFQGQGEVDEIRLKDNKDGTTNATYLIKPLFTQIKRSETELQVPEDITNTYKIKEKSRSQALRQKAWVIAQELGVSEEALYNSAMDEANNYLDQYKDN